MVTICEKGRQVRGLGAMRENDTEIHRQRRSCEDRGRQWRDATTNQRIIRQNVEEAKIDTS